MHGPERRSSTTFSVRRDLTARMHERFCASVGASATRPSVSTLTTPALLRIASSNLFRRQFTSLSFARRRSKSDPSPAKLCQGLGSLLAVPISMAPAPPQSMPLAKGTNLRSHPPRFECLGRCLTDNRWAAFSLHPVADTVFGARAMRRKGFDRAGFNRLIPKSNKSDRFLTKLSFPRKKSCDLSA
jgi:hypothetical protein